MSSAGVNQYPDPPHKRAAIEAWISTVSNHPPLSAMASPLGFLDSDDEGITVPRSRVVIPQQPGVIICEYSRTEAPRLTLLQAHETQARLPPRIHKRSQHLPAIPNWIQTSRILAQPNTAIKLPSKGILWIPKSNLCIERIRKSDSPAYLNYHDPTVIEPRTGCATHNRFKCKHCNQIVEHPIGVSYTLNLSSHSKKCTATTKQSQSLGAFGITGGSLHTLTAEQLQKLLHPDARKYQPHRDTISKDIRRIYRATQGEIADMLEKQLGISHLALNLFQSSNRLDFLGIVIFRHLFTLDKLAKVECFVLECISRLALNSNSYIVWGIVCNNASNNGTMMKELAMYDLKRLKGPQSRVHCVLHVINLAAKAITLPFCTKRERLEKIKPLTDDDDDDDTMSQYLQDSEDPDIDLNNDGLDAPQMLEPLNADDKIFVKINIPPMEKDSPGELERSRVAKTLYKAAKLAHGLRYTPAARAKFKRICLELEVEAPHNLRSNVQTRWNSTNDMLEDIKRLWPAVIEFQNTLRWSSHALAFAKEEYPTCQPLQIVTKILSHAGVLMLADVIVHYDALDAEYAEMCNNDALPLYHHHAANQGRLLLNKYYQVSDKSEMYRLAILMHPSMRKMYLTHSGWEPDWITATIEIAERCWCNHYQPTAASAEVLTPVTS
ncbi:hypothetical protein BDV93DRAFT_506193 [Ceratobasidium sp. AG-I]|nr:hypothetical protein BDV93DRAFT_506193 [Ceratobasidium sp. AG-I]